MDSPRTARQSHGGAAGLDNPAFVKNQVAAKKSSNSGQCAKQARAFLAASPSSSPISTASSDSSKSSGFASLVTGVAADELCRVPDYYPIARKAATGGPPLSPISNQPWASTPTPTRQLSSSGTIGRQSRRSSIPAMIYPVPSFPLLPAAGPAFPYRTLQQQNGGKHVMLHASASMSMMAQEGAPAGSSRLYRIGLLLFNHKPNRGIAFLIEHGALRGRYSQSDAATDIGAFLFQRRGLNKALIGEFLGQRELVPDSASDTLRGIDLTSVRRYV